MRNHIVHVDGGIGKNLMATAVVAALHEKINKKDRIIVVASWPAVWINNPDVYRVYPQGNHPYFYEDYIKDKECKIYKTEPYHNENYILHKAHCAVAWGEQWGITVKDTTPKLRLTPKEIEHAKAQVFNAEDQRPVLLLQTHGGGQQDYKQSWVRDIPIQDAQAFVNIIAPYYRVVHIRREDQLPLQNCDVFQTNNIRHLLALTAASEHIVCIDSYLQHTAAALGKKALVCWPIDNVKRLGYDCHYNLVSSAPTIETHMIDSYLHDFNISGELHECPFTEDSLFPVADLNDALSEMLKDPAEE
jgi:hypothetical protein